MANPNPQLETALAQFAAQPGTMPDQEAQLRTAVVADADRLALLNQQVAAGDLKAVVGLQAITVAFAHKTWQDPAGLPPIVGQRITELTRTSLSALLCALAVAACTTAPQTPSTAKEAAAMSAIASPLDQVRLDQLSALKQGIDDIAASDFADIQVLDRHLSTELSSAQQQEEPSNPRLLIRSREGGSLAGLKVSRVELVTYKDGDPSDARLSIDLAEPGPDADTFARMYWPNAELTPSSPHGAGSPSFWTFKQGDHTVSIDFKRDDTRIIGIGFSRDR